MCKVYACNRCGKYFFEGDHTDKQYDIGSTIATEHLDEGRKWLCVQHLCPKCFEDFFNWLYCKDKYEITLTKKYKKNLKERKKNERK